MGKGLTNPAMSKLGFDQGQVVDPVLTVVYNINTSGQISHKMV